MSKVINYDLPSEVMSEVAWSFTGDVYSGREKFDQKVRKYQADIAGNAEWQPDQVVLPVANARIVYTCSEGDDDIEKMVDLNSDDGKAFTAGELLYKLHNAVVRQLSAVDRHFFEGLSLNSRPIAYEPPVYVMYLGS